MPVDSASTRTESVGCLDTYLPMINCTWNRAPRKGLLKSCTSLRLVRPSVICRFQIGRSVQVSREAVEALRKVIEMPMEK